MSDTSFGTDVSVVDVTGYVPFMTLSMSSTIFILLLLFDIFPR